MAYGHKTSDLMDIPLKRDSFVTPYLSDNGYKFEGVNSISVLSIDNGILSDYNEASATDPFGAPNLVTPNEQLLELTYNKSMLLRIQKTQMQDIPVSKFSKKVALQQISEVFIPSHDEYSAGKVLAARPVANKLTFTAGTDERTRTLAKTIKKVSENGGSNVVTWINMDFATDLSADINFTGSDKGYADAQKGYIGKYKDSKLVEVPTRILGDTVMALAFDKRAVINVKPKMDPKKDMTVLEKLPGFSGIEIQLRDRADTFVLNKKANLIASLETA